MTEKRFKLAYCDYDWWAICDNENKNELGISGQEVVDLMNELAEENMMLKGENTHYKLLLMSLEETAKKFCEIPKVKE